MVHGKLGFEAVGGDGEGRRGDPGAVNEDVEVREGEEWVAEEGFCGGGERAEGGEVDYKREGLHPRVERFDVGDGGGEGGGVAAGEDEEARGTGGEGEGGGVAD